jgi:hypothetical protein
MEDESTLYFHGGVHGLTDNGADLCVRPWRQRDDVPRHAPVRGAYPLAPGSYLDGPTSDGLVPNRHGVQRVLLLEPAAKAKWMF